MHTKDRLARAIQAAGLPDRMVKIAAVGGYDDYLSALPFPKRHLVRELEKHGTPAALVLRDLVIAGHYDNTEAEGDAWAETPEGKASVAKALFGGD